MKINNITIKILSTIILSTSALTACNDKKFDPPNKDKPSNGTTAEKAVLTGTAMNVLKYSDPMAKAWSPDAVLVGMNGVSIDRDGKDQETLNNSQWIISYFSPKKSPSNVYTITFNGKGIANWLENTQNYGINNNVSNFSIDSYKLLSLPKKLDYQIAILIYLN